MEGQVPVPGGVNVNAGGEILRAALVQEGDMLNPAALRFSSRKRRVQEQRDIGLLPDQLEVDLLEQLRFHGRNGGGDAQRIRKMPQGAAPPGQAVHNFLGEPPDNLRLSGMEAHQRTDEGPGIAPSENAALLREQHPSALPGRGDRRAKTGGAGPGHQDIVVFHHRLVPF